MISVIAELRDLNLELESLKARKDAIKKHLQEHRDTITDVQLVEQTEEARQIKADIEATEQKIKDAQERAKTLELEGEKRIMENLDVEKRTTQNNEIMERAEKFARENRMVISNAETRSVLVSGGKIATPTGVSGINDAFNKVSSIVDQVKVVDCTGMGSNKVAYEKNIATANTTTEGANYNESDPVFDFVTITPETVTVISYISKQVRKQSPLAYEEKVRSSALSALRKKVGSIIVSKIVASELNTTLDGVTAIDATTLRKIAMNYGGDENVVGNAVLYLNKKDLIKFGDVRGTNEKKAVYEITPNAANPNTGIIKDGGLSVEYCINSSLTEGTMLYGQPIKCELDLFSDYEIAVSEDFKFNQGLLAIRGDVQLGADVVASEGFVKVVIGG